MNKPDIIDVLNEMNNDIRNNPLLEFLIIIRLIIKKCKCYKRNIPDIDNESDYDTQLDKLIDLLENLKKYINLSKQHLLTLGISDTEFFNHFEKKGLTNIDDIIYDLKNNRTRLTPQEIKSIVNFMIKILNKFLS